jgi:putative solute:sodium symporter small subunit
MMKPEETVVTIFKPRGANMRSETRVIALVLTSWLAAVVGSQLVVCFLEHFHQGAILSRWTLFNLPIPFWLTGQFLPLWFIILCVLFNFWMDRHAARSLDGALRYRVRSRREGGS